MNNSMNDQDIGGWLEPVVELAQLAGEKILEVYNSDEFSVQEKDDKSPLTAADLAAHHAIVAGLTALTPYIPVLSEESASLPFAERSSWKSYWLVDPLDGTREFIKRNGEFTVNIALIDHQVPTLGVVHVPVTGVTYSGDVDRQIAMKETPEGRASVASRRLDRNAGGELIVVGSRRHGSEALDALVSRLRTRFDAVQLTSMGSSLKLCLVAEGKADFYPRLAPTCEWDTGAAHAVVLAAGGAVLDEQFKPLRYNTKAELLNPNFFVIGDIQATWSELLS